MVLICISLITKDSEHFFMFIYHLYIYQFLYQTFNNVCMFIKMLSYKNFIHVGWKSLVRHMFQKYFSRLVAVQSTFLAVVFKRADVSNFDKIHFTNFFFHSLLLMSKPIFAWPKVTKVFCYVFNLLSVVAFTGTLGLYESTAPGQYYF